MATQEAQTTGADTSKPAHPSGTLLLTKIKPGQADALRATLAQAKQGLTDPSSGLAQVGTVHFARMAIIDDQYLLFASHFDGDFDDYLDDFFSFNGGKNFDVVWRYTEDWPGPGDREKFKDFWKSHEVPDLVMYSYYPGVTCKEIEKAVRIRRNMEAVLEDFQ
jgi:hypothetical protein